MMPCTVLFIKDYEENKKGDRVRVPGRQFVKLHRLGVAKRVPTIPEYLKPNKVEKPKAKTAPKKKGTNPNSLKNLKKPKKTG